MMDTVDAAATYARADDVWLLTTYFNPAGYHTKRRNYQLFRNKIKSSNLNLFTIECAFSNDAFILPAGPEVMQVRAKHVMWQKERLLNVAIPHLPKQCTKIVWLDCDILFENSQWVVETSRLLDHYPVVQPFTTAVRLPSGERDYRGKGEVWRGFGAIHAIDPDCVGAGDYDRHGETGFAWAARRSVIAAAGLYDACIIGGGDHVMAHAMCGDWTSPCMDRLLGLHTAGWRHALRWGQAFYRQVYGQIGHVPGAVLHLWHGDSANRRYSLRHRELNRFAFAPETDLQVGPTGCWEWASHKDVMHRWAADYFTARREDDVYRENSPLAAKLLGE
jgi:hypothetical protein